MAKAGGIRRAAPARFIAFCGEPVSLRAWLSTLVPGSDRPERLNRVLDCADIVIYASPETRFAFLGAEEGLVLADRARRGAGRERSGPEVTDAAVEAAMRVDLATAPPPGDYAAFLRARGGVVALRGPGGAVAIHYAAFGNVAAFLSHPGLRRPLSPPGSRARAMVVSRQGELRRLGPGVRFWFGTATG